MPNGVAQARQLVVGGIEFCLQLRETTIAIHGRYLIRERAQALRVIGQWRRSCTLHDMKVATATLAIVIAAGGGQGATERLALRVTPNVSNAPSTVTIRATIEPNAANRYLFIEADSGSFYRSSEVQLEGDRAPLVTQMFLKDLPSGEYTVAAELRDNMGGRTKVRRMVIVLSRFTENP